MEYDTTGMDVDYVQSQYPNESREVIIRAMLIVRNYGYPKDIGIILWFEFVLFTERVFTRSKRVKRRK